MLTKESTMRILFDSKLPQYKTPFGTLIPQQICTLNIHIPVSVQATKVTCIVKGDDCTTTVQEIAFAKKAVSVPYEIWNGEMCFHKPGLYFYYFYITTPEGGFRLFKQGDDTNMEAGALWQVSCIPADFHTPDWAKGATIYQVFPDRFFKAGDCDLTGKLTPYVVHENWKQYIMKYL